MEVQMTPVVDCACERTRRPAIPTRRRTWGAVIALVTVAAAGTAWSPHAVRAQDRRTVWDKVYAADQAALGKTEYDTHCSGCHQKDLSGRDGGGEGPELAGGAFTKKWDLQPLNQLYTEIKQRMPRDQPGTLSAEAYLNVVAYILQANKYPAGERALTADTALLTSTFIARTEPTKVAASETVTTGSLIQVVGCLENASGGWALTQTTAPLRTENPDASSPDQLKKLAAAPSGTGTLRLLGVYAALDEHKGHRMEGKGFLVKDPDGDRINVVSLELVAPTCAP
jgi:mono/diheme cytochrome c family protein